MFTITDWFNGVVVDNNDPKKLGRVKVRLPIGHDKEKGIEPGNLAWATLMMPATNAGLMGVGQSPTGIMIGTKVFGVWLDGSTSKKHPMIIGTYNIIDEGDEKKHSVSSIARGDGPVKKNYMTDLGELETAYATQYPYNKTMTTQGGHVVEIDDTPGAERIHIYHKSGSYVEMFPDGKVIAKTMGDNLNIALGDQNITSVDGNINLTCNNGRVRIVSDQPVDIVSTSSVVNVQAPLLNLNA